MEPKPHQKPHPPLWFGGGHPNVSDRPAEVAAELWSIVEAGAEMVLLNPLYDQA